jgi:hypothetical protein
MRAQAVESMSQTQRWMNLASLADVASSRKHEGYSRARGSVGSVLAHAPRADSMLEKYPSLLFAPSGKAQEENIHPFPAREKAHRQDAYSAGKSVCLYKFVAQSFVSALGGTEETKLREGRVQAMQTDARAYMDRVCTMSFLSAGGGAASWIQVSAGGGAA